MRKAIILFVFAICPLFVKAQQQGLQSLYMFNGLSVNPAYAGSHYGLSGTLLVRFQGVGLDGAPGTQMLAVHSPLNNEKIALGALLVNEEIGVINQFSFNGSYAYKIRFDNDRVLSLGLQAGIYSYRAQYSELTVQNPDDPAFKEDVSSWKPNFGMGFYYESLKFYAGVSMPHLANDVFTSDVSGVIQSNPIIVTGGYEMRLSADIDFKPNALFKFVNNRPVEFDINAFFVYDDMLGAGLSVKTWNTVSVITSFQLSRQLNFAYAYGLTTNSLRVADHGSHEILLNYKF